MSQSEISETMRAAVCRVYGTSQDISLETLPVPSIGNDQVLVQVIAVGLNAADRYILWGKPYMIRLAYGLTKPKHLVPGQDIAGVVVQVGASCVRLKPGDRVFGQGGTGLAEFAAIPEKKLQIIPDGLGFRDASALSISGTTSIQANDAANVEEGTNVLIHGASGGVGSTTTKIAFARGANITATCSARNADIVASFGADTVLDYAHDTLLDPADPYDAIIDCAGNLPMRVVVKSLVPGGTLVRVGFSSGEWIGPIAQMVAAPVVSIAAPGSVKVLSSQTSLESLAEIARLAEQKMISPHIEREYPLSHIRDAFARLESGRIVGKVVVRVAPDWG